MLFVEPFFLLIFLPATLVLFWASRRIAGAQGALMALLAVSIGFYFKFSPWFGLLLACSVSVNYACGAYLIQPGPEESARRKTVLWLGQAYNLATLIWFKYLHNLGLVTAFSGPHAAAVSDAGIPLGISFYTFHQAVFLMDAASRQPVVLQYLGDIRGWRGKLRGFGRYGAFVFFFPQLVIGPIVYLKEFAASTLRQGFGRFNRQDLEVGLTFVTLGLFKKIVIADQLALNTSRVFGAADGGVIADPLVAWSGVLAYCFQIYFDFSGYSDIALGLARMLGVRLPINFDSPLRATGIADYYQRWHITLTRVIARFLFTPLSLWGTRRAGMLPLKSKRRRLMASWIPIVCNFVVIQLWHGAVLTFLLYGVMHGLWYVLEVEMKSLKAWKAWAKKTPPARIRLLGRLITFPFLTLTFSVFGSHSFAGLKNLLESLPVARAPVGSGFILGDWLMILAAGAVTWLLPNSVEFLRRYRPGIFTYRKPSSTPAALAFRWRPTPAWALANAALLLVVVWKMWLSNQHPPFLYQGF